MKRNTFLKMGACILLTPFYQSLPLAAAEVPCSRFSGDELLKKLLAANDKQTGILLQTITGSNSAISRKTGYDVAALSAAFVSPGSAYYHNPLLVSKLSILTNALLQHQSADGTVNIANLESPPDTAFLVEILSAAAVILIKDNSPELAAINKELKKFLLKTGDALTTGGVHTPNHRWVICAALARLHSLFPHKKYAGRIEDWLGEGIYMDADGHYPERSAGIYAGVENNSLLTIARMLNKPALLNYVRKNLEMTWYYMEPNGDIVTTDSRRQDQYLSLNIVTYYYLNYRYMAIKDGNKKFAAIARQMETMESFEKDILNKDYFHFLENVALQQALPEQVSIPDNYEKLFTTSKLLRIRRGNTSSTFFGGVDWPLLIASGRSNSPDFFSYRKGKAILKHIRLSSGFFSMGYFYSEGLKKEGPAYILYKKLEIPYYQPLPNNKRNKQGDYKLTPSIDDRFWNKMDFRERPVSNVKTLETRVILEETNGTNMLTFRVTGTEGVPVTIELCFREGGILSGITDNGDDNYFLEKGDGKYELDGDSISFGPGSVTHKKITGLEGERYGTHFGSLRTKGMHVFITGTTPFIHTLRIS